MKCKAQYFAGDLPFVYLPTFQQGRKFTLTSGKVIKDKNGGRGGFPSASKIDLLYINKQCLKEELGKICNFSVMKPEKIVARLGENSVCLCLTSSVECDTIYMLMLLSQYISKYGT